MDSNRNGNWMLTYTGISYWPLDPRPEEVEIRDIAHALSNLCRYTGHVRKFYSVAEHSVLVSHMVAPEHALQGLLHDAAEAYCNDLARPLKVCLPEYKAVEQLNFTAIMLRFALPVVEHPTIKAADTDILINEYQALMEKPTLPWSWGGTFRDKMPIRGWLPKKAEEMFLKRFYKLTKFTHVNRG
jgi:uncharacterized protein